MSDFLQFALAPGTLLVLLGWAIAGGSPGPATLAISSTAMSQGRAAGLAIASGVVVGSASWGIAAGLGMSALMLTHVWIFEVVRYAGALYLLFLAIKSLRNAMRPTEPATAPKAARQALFLKGLALHLTNPKAVLAWGSIYAIVLPVEAAPILVWYLFALLITVSCIVFLGYGMLFSAPPLARGYARMRRGFEVAFAVLFGAASLKLLTARLV